MTPWTSIILWSCKRHDLEHQVEIVGKMQEQITIPMLQDMHVKVRPEAQMAVNCIWLLQSTKAHSTKFVRTEVVYSVIAGDFTEYKCYKCCLCQVTRYETSNRKIQNSKKILILGPDNSGIAKKDGAESWLCLKFLTEVHKKTFLCYCNNKWMSN